MTKSALQEAASVWASSQPMRVRRAIAGDMKGFMTHDEKTQENEVLRRIEGAGANLSANVLARKAAADMVRGLITMPGAPMSLEDSSLVNTAFVNDPSQDEALRVMVENHYVALIGAAGTGKTTILKQAIGRLIYGTPATIDSEGNEVPGIPGLGVRNLDGKQGPSIAIATFTGVASSVVRASLPPWCAPMVKTIHTLLEYSPVSEGSKMFEPKRGTQNKLDHDIIIIDEAGQAGLTLMHQIMDAITPETRVYLSGDLNQLVPIADTPYFPYVLANATSENPTWSVAELTTVHRQKGEGGNRVLTAAHAVLAGRKQDLVFDRYVNLADKTKNRVDEGKPWFVAGIEVSSSTDKAHGQIVSVMKHFMNHNTLDEFGNEETHPVYQPFEDLILTPGNGYDLHSRGAVIQQAPLNETLSRLIVPAGDDAVFMIDAGRVSKSYSVGDRIMCLNNEPHGTKDRVTNGTLGVIEMIEDNSSWNGDRVRFGSKVEVVAHQNRMLGIAVEHEQTQLDAGVDIWAAFESGMAVTGMVQADPIHDKQSSHILTVRYKNGAVRRLQKAIDVENTCLAYAVTTHKAQGSQANTVFIICHGACAARLTREWLYTSFTRAVDRVIVFYTDLGLNLALSRQQIKGKTLKEKIENYQRLLIQGDRIVRLVPD